METKHFVGIDVSKETLDISLVKEGQVIVYSQIKNTTEQIKSSLPKLLKQCKATFGNTLFCMEYTGIYSMLLIKWLQQKEATIWMESGIHIKKSMGLTRGKSDKADSNRIALFAFTNRHKVKLYKAPRLIIEKLKALDAQRSRLVKAKALLVKPVQEHKKFIDASVSKAVEKFATKAGAEIAKQIIAVEKEIKRVIAADDRLKKLYSIITSVDGIGFVTAVYMLVSTNEFISINDAKKYACYSGVVPFEHTSGTSVKGKKRVSQVADKNIKKLLHMAALTAIQHKGELQDYYFRKVKEGKNKMSVLNAIRNKLILRVFACVHRGAKFEKEYQYKVA